MKAKWVNIVDSLQGNIEGDLIEETGMQKRNKKEWRKPIYREIDRSNREPKYRHIEISIYRRGKKENKANHK